MVTRFYIPTTGAPPVTPAAWQFPTLCSGGTLTTQAVTVRINSSAVIKTHSFGMAALNDSVGFFRVVSQALAAQTISGTAKGQMRTLEDSATANAVLGFAVKIVKPDGTDRAVLLGVTNSPNFTTTPPEFAVSAVTRTNRQLLDSTSATPITLTSGTAQAGDFLVIEFGSVFQAGVSGTNRNLQLTTEDDSATDLPEDNTTTVANNPWIEFSANITFSSGGAGGGGASRFALGTMRPGRQHGRRV